MRDRRKWLSAGALVGLVLTIASQTPADAGAATECSIDYMAVEYGIGLFPAELRKDGALQTALTFVEATNPGAVVKEEKSVELQSDRLPTVNGRHAVILRLEGVAPGIAGATPPPEGVDFAAPRVQVTCAVSIFDATTGEWLVSLIDSVPMR